MSAAETIAKAIEKLERLKAGARPGPWWHQPYGGQNQNGDYSGGDIFAEDGDYLVSEVDDASGDLIVTLRRTIDAQLAILRHAERHAIGAPFRRAFDLATAILGGDK